MKANDLLKQVSIAAQVVDTNCLVPIAKNLWFKDSTICATDLNLNIIVNTEFDFGETAVAVDSQKLVALLKSLKNQSIKVDFAFPSTKVTSETGVYDISSYDGADFPLSEIEVGENSAKGFLFELALDLTKGSVSTDELRPVMTGVYFDSDLGYVVSTNGHKLSRYKASFKESFILPLKAAGLFKHVSEEDVKYKQTGNMIHFATDDILFSIRKVEGNYPPYDRVIPTTNDKTLTIKQSELLGALKRISLFSSQDSSSIALDLGEEIIIKGEDLNFGNKGQEKLEGDFDSPEGFTIGLNAKYLIELLNTTGEGTLTITFSEPNKPVLINNSNNPRYLQLIMPVTI